MTKHLLSLAAAAAFIAFAVPVQACERHQSHAAMTTAEAVPVPEAKPVTVIRTPAVTTEEKAVMSTPYTSESGYMGCNRRAKEQTVYLTQ